MLYSLFTPINRKGQVRHSSSDNLVSFICPDYLKYCEFIGVFDSNAAHKRHTSFNDRVFLSNFARSYLESTYGAHCKIPNQD